MNRRGHLKHKHHSFTYAFRGVRLMATDYNMLVHLPVAAVVVAAGVYFKLSGANGVGLLRLLRWC